MTMTDINIITAIQNLPQESIRPLYGGDVKLMALRAIEKINNKLYGVYDLYYDDPIRIEVKVEFEANEGLIWARPVNSKGSSWSMVGAY